MGMIFQDWLGFRVVAVATGEFLALMLHAASGRRQALTIGYLNAAQVNLAFEQRAFAQALRRFNWLYADGQAVVWAARRQVGEEAEAAAVPERINAGDFTAEVMRGLAERKLKLALVGGRTAAGEQPGEAERAAALFKAWAPGLEIALIRDGYFAADEADGVWESIEAADPDLVLLGMGAPRQERWALEWAGRGTPRVYWCVGALFEYYAGSRMRAPKWMRRAGLEWLVRLVLEPRRLAWRYLIGNPLFVYRAWRNSPPR